jgi:hypothetical protein
VKFSDLLHSINDNQGLFMMNVKFLICLSIIILLLSHQQIFSQELQPSLKSNPLSGFETIIGGEWHQQGGYQIFKWGLGKKSVIA